MNLNFRPSPYRYRHWQTSNFLTLECSGFPPFILFLTVLTKTTKHPSHRKFFKFRALKKFHPNVHMIGVGGGKNFHTLPPSRVPGLGCPPPLRWCPGGRPAHCPRRTRVPPSTASSGALGVVVLFRSVVRPREGRRNDERNLRRHHPPASCGGGLGSCHHSDHQGTEGRNQSTPAPPRFSAFSPILPHRETKGWKSGGNPEPSNFNVNHGSNRVEFQDWVALPMAKAGSSAWAIHIVQTKEWK